MEPRVTVQSDHDGLRVVQSFGEFDADTEGVLAAACDEAIAAPRVERLALDLRGVTFADPRS